MAGPAKAYCGVCKRERERQKMHTITPTESDREAIRKLGVEPQDEYIYCRPCWQIMCDRERGAQLLKGMVQTRLRSLGATNSEKSGQKVYDLVTSRASKKLVS